MVIDTQEYALLSSDVYHELHGGDSIGSGRFDVVEVCSDPSGLYGAIPKDSHTKRLIAAFRGTEFSNDKMWDVFETDAQMLMQGVNQQLDGARRLVELALAMSKADEGTGKPVSVSVTGHSLGGTLAQVMSYEYNLYGETFNAYGAAGLGGVPLDRRVAAGHNTIVDHIRATDMVALVNMPYGEVKKYATLEDTEFKVAAQRPCLLVLSTCLGV